jgi:ABC-type multidrug transport system fused ATPase/permease subunit
MKLITILFNFATFRKKKTFYILQFLWMVNSVIQSINIYVYGYFFIILGKEFGELSKNFSIIENDLQFLNKIYFFTFKELVFFIIFFAIFSNLLNFYLIKFSNRHFCKIAEYVQYLLLKKYVKMDYEHFINKRFDKKSSSILTDSQKIYGLLMSFGNLLFNISSLIIIFSILLIINFKISLFTFFALGLMYFVFSQKTKKILASNSNIFSTLGMEKINLINTCLNGLRELKIYNSEDFNLNKFEELTSKVAISKASTATLALAPRYFIESFFFISIGFLIFIIFNFESIDKSLFSYLLILIISFSRLIPSFQYIYNFFSTLQDGSVSIKNINEELNLKEKIVNPTGALNVNENIKRIKPELIEFKKIGFKFISNERKIIHNLNCSISAGDKIFVSGETGAGKSTFLDILAGLLKIDEGKILVNKSLKFRSLSKIFKQSYVSQFPFLLNSSIVENISFKKSVNNDELKFIKNIVDQLSLNDVIKNDEDLFRVIGDFGNNLSGGQKQRICIARALFFKPDILILDESLNAVDKKKRIDVLSKIIKLNKDQILLYVSHDQNDLINFNKQFFFEKNAITQKIS